MKEGTHTLTSPPWDDMNQKLMKKALDGSITGIITSDHQLEDNSIIHCNAAPEDQARIFQHFSGVRETQKQFPVWAFTYVSR
ncbi:hypothetical protein [Pedobacter sp. SYSU D00535]|uniref:hypothetical protein n=1 Tax=Pedobacter sp. SYSU D00535 TaxID=2810308 RepID=UPI001A95800A|nr:hypothetical protein [Pedobacter sp. SYSU D00535]